jgi:LysM repeat protein
MPSQKEYEEMAQDYQYSLAFLKSDPEIWKAFKQAIKEDQTADAFVASLQETKWFRTHSDTYRTNWEQMHGPDKATWETRLSEAKASLKDRANQFGANMSDKELSRMSKDALLYGWNDAQIQNNLAKYVEVNKSGAFGGQAGVNEDALRKIAFDYGVKMSETSLKKWVINLAKGDTTLQDYKGDMSRQAEIMYPAYKEQVRKGATMREIAQPYLQTMAQTLELNPENIDLFDRHIQGALKNQYADLSEAGGKREFNMYDYERQLRQDERFLRTKQAQQQTSALTMKIMQDWGFQS